MVDLIILGGTMKFAKSACVFAAMLSFASMTAVPPAAAQDQYKAQIDALRKSMEKYQDYKVAVRDLYLSTVGCVHYSGEKIADHMVYAKGAMGVHFVNLTIKGPPDPMKPNVLIYEPVGKKLKLVAVEWLVPVTPDTKEAPSLFGQTFMGPMEGHEPSFRRNSCTTTCMPGCSRTTRSACSQPTNPKVNCKGYEFELLEKPTKAMHAH